MDRVLLDEPEFELWVEPGLPVRRASQIRREVNELLIEVAKALEQRFPELTVKTAAETNTRARGHDQR